MSGGNVCRCPESKKPAQERKLWVVMQYKCNHSAFNGYHYTPSDYSSIRCDGPGCNGLWRTKAAYVDDLPTHDTRRG